MTTAGAKVSVIIPAYNAARYIAATLDSVFGQTYPAIEVVVVNDGSTDETEKALAPFLDKPNMVYVKQANKGCSGAKNTGLFAADGQFIQYLDADDLLSADKIENQVKAIANDPMAVAVCKTKIFQEADDLISGREIDTDFLYNTTDTLSFLLNLYGINGKDGMVQPNAFLISRELALKAGPWDESISPSPDEDGEYFCRVLLKASSLLHTEGVNFYRKQAGQYSLSKGRSLKFAMGALRSIVLKAGHVLAVKDTPEIRALFARHIASCIYQYGNEHPELAAQARREIAALGVEKMPVSGGGKFVLLAKLIGFKNAMAVKKIITPKRSAS